MSDVVTIKSVPLNGSTSSTPKAVKELKHWFVSARGMEFHFGLYGDSYFYGVVKIDPEGTETRKAVLKYKDSTTKSLDAMKRQALTWDGEVYTPYYPNCQDFAVMLFKFATGIDVDAAAANKKSSVKQKRHQALKINIIGIFPPEDWCSKPGRLRSGTGITVKLDCSIVKEQTQDLVCRYTGLGGNLRPLNGYYSSASPSVKNIPKNFTLDAIMEAIDNQIDFGHPSQFVVNNGCDTVHFGQIKGRTSLGDVRFVGPDGEVAVFYIPFQLHLKLNRTRAPNLFFQIGSLGLLNFANRTDVRESTIPGGIELRVMFDCVTIVTKEVK